MIYQKKTNFSLALVALVTLGLSGCSLNPFSSDEYAELEQNPSRTSASAQISPPPPASQDYSSLTLPQSPPPLGTTNFEPVSPEVLVPSGTLASKKVLQLREDLMLLQRSISEQNQELQIVRNEITQSTQLYHSVIASISTRLQVGTTPGNPILVQQWNQAQDQLEQINRLISDLNNLSNTVAGSATLSGYLLDASNAAYSLSGAIEEDHRQLGILENDIRRTMVLVDRLLAELSKDISRQTSYLGNEKRNMRTLSLAIKNGELYGRSFSGLSQSRPLDRMAPRVMAGTYVPQVDRSPITPQQFSQSPQALQEPSFGGGFEPFQATGRMAASVPSQDPLVIIRFDDGGVDYERPLYEAVSKALERRSDLGFQVVSVSPEARGSFGFSRGKIAAEENAQRVMRSLTEMGIDSSRVTMTAQQAPYVDGNEVRLYLR